MFTLRPAQPSEAQSIRDLIHTVGINPMGLDWRRFILALTPAGQVIGCGQIKPHGDGSRELASIAVKPGWQGRGVGSAIVERLLGSQEGPLYLTCRARLGPYYRRFGFQVIEQGQMPPYFRRVKRIFRLLKALRLVHEDLLVMKKAAHPRGSD